MEPAGPGLKAVENETKGTISRTTSDGRKLTYQLTVLQQPSRARACGAGAKSSADRRPVDPPPIVELKIFEELENETPRDITFSVNANYFLFATLEQARTMVTARGMSDNQNQLTVLTGTPVSGMVLLDRPSPAGYFIFADLSVRHEGKYRLSFSLYEELKSPQDEDPHEDLTRPQGAHVTHRLEVKSIPFTVFSAKKFPGLTESTSLSRVVAEQGCRVRIRRDVRMRRRDQKPGKDWDGYEDETADARARMSATPEGSVYQGLPPPHHYMDPISRPRSSSNTSHHSLAPSLSLPRRTSIQDIGYQQHGYGTAPQTPQTAYPQVSPYGPSPTHNYGSNPFMHQQSMQPPPPQYQQPAYQQSAPLPHPPASQSQYYAYGSSTPSTQQQVAPGAPAYEPRERHRSSADRSMSIQNESSRPTIGFGPPPPLPHAPAYGPKYTYSSEMNSQSGYQPQSQTSYSSHHSHQASYGSSSDYFNNRAPPPQPLEPMQPQARPSFTTPPISERPFSSGRLPPISTSFNTSNNKQPEPAPPSPLGPQSSYYSAVQTPTESHKRGYDQVFDGRHLHEPLKQAARPSESNSNYSSQFYVGGDVEGDGNEPLKLTYKRSDGNFIHREMPAHHQYA